jgi:hypothetical protein
MEPIVTVTRAARIPLAIFLFGSLFGALATLAAVNLTRRERVVVREVATHCPTRVVPSVAPPAVMMFDGARWDYRSFYYQPRTVFIP